MVRWLDRRRISRRQLKGGWVHRVLGDRVLAKDLWRPSREGVARAWLIGVPITFLPFLPIQSLLACSIGLFFRANIFVCLALQFVSTPITAPIHLPACYLVGRAIQGDSPAVVWREVWSKDWTKVSSYSASDILALYSGAVVLGGMIGVAGFFAIRALPRRRIEGGSQPVSDTRP
jgi:uncharacterized protein (DUF2062 family)